MVDVYKRQPLLFVSRFWPTHVLWLQSKSRLYVFCVVYIQTVDFFIFSFFSTKVSTHLPLQRVVVSCFLFITQVWIKKKNTIFSMSKFLINFFEIRWHSLKSIVIINTCPQDSSLLCLHTSLSLALYLSFCLHRISAYISAPFSLHPQKCREDNNGCNNWVVSVREWTNSSAEYVSPKHAVILVD